MTIHSPGLRLGLLDALVGGDAGADERRGLLGVKAGRYVGDVVRVGDDVLGKAAVLGVAAELRLGAHRLPGRQAILAMTASRVEPGHADPVALLDDRDAGADRGDEADGLMARNERQLGLQRPVAGRGMEIGVADAAGLGLDQDLAGAGRWECPTPAAPAAFRTARRRRRASCVPWLAPCSCELNQSICDRTIRRRP